MTIRLSEAGALGSKSGGRKYRCKLIEAGQGSSGLYSADMLAEYGPQAFPVGTHSYLNHKSYDEEWNQPERRVQDIAGVLVSTPEFYENALWGDIEFNSQGAALVEELKDHIGLSIYAIGESEEYDGGVNITKMLYSPLNSIDIVTRAGAGGKIMELAESFRAPSAEPTTTTDSRGEITERIEMDEKDIERIVEAIKTSLVPALKEALTPPVVEPAEDKKELDIAAVAEAVNDAKLPKVLRDKVYAAVKEGVDVTDAVTEAKALVEAVKSMTPETPADTGVIKESGTKTETYTVSGWSA